jgi:hypothetical protein
VFPRLGVFALLALAFPSRPASAAPGPLFHMTRTVGNSQVAAQKVSGMVITTPTVLTTLVGNPGMGMQTFYRTKATDGNNGILPLGSAYTRYYWSTVEPTQGDFSFTRLGDDYTAARAEGQEYCTRISPYDYTGAGPEWLRSMGASGYMITEGGNGTPVWIPNMDDPTVKAEFGKLVQALGARFDGLPGFGPIDIGSVGLWGEWHNWRAVISAINGDAPGSVGDEVPMPPLATCKWYVDLYFTHFPMTIKLMLSGEPAGSVTAQTLAYALGRGAGWRVDALGDPYHMENRIVQALPGGANDTHWQTAPVYSEPYPWAHIDTASAVDFALSVHASAVHDRDRGRRGFTARELPEVKRLLLKLGYRFVLNALSYPRTVSAGQPVTMTMVWQNIGVAPTYRNDVLAIQIRDASGTPVLTSNTGIAVRKWLPDTTYTVTPTVTLPTGSPAGAYTVALGIVDPATMTPVVRLAIEGRDANGWYPLGTIGATR